MLTVSSLHLLLKVSVRYTRVVLRAVYAIQSFQYVRNISLVKGLTQLYSSLLQA